MAAHESDGFYDIPVGDEDGDAIDRLSNDDVRCDVEATSNLKNSGSSSASSEPSVENRESSSPKKRSFRSYLARVLDLNIYKNPKATRDEKWMHIVYFALVSTLLFATFICEIVGLASSMSITPLIDGEAGWSQNSFRQCSTVSGDCTSYSQDELSVQCSQWSAGDSDEDEDPCAAIWTSGNGSRAAGGFAMFCTFICAGLLGTVAYYNRIGKWKLYTLPHQLFGSCTFFTGVLALASFATWATGSHGKIKDLQDASGGFLFADSRLGAGFHAWVAAFLFCAATLVLEFLLWWRQQEPVRSPPWIGCWWLPNPLPKEAAEKSPTVAGEELAP